MSPSLPQLSRNDRRAREEQLLKALASRVRFLRDMRGMSRKLFAESSHVSLPHMAGWRPARATSPCSYLTAWPGRSACRSSL